MNKPRILMTRREKYIDRRVNQIVTVVGFAVAIRDYRDRKEKEELELERLHLENKLLQKEIDQNKLKILQA